jgi:hypothetical protein
VITPVPRHCHTLHKNGCSNKRHKESWWPADVPGLGILRGPGVRYAGAFLLSA